MSPTYYRKSKSKLHDRAMKGVAGRERKRLALDPGNWRRVFSLLVVGHASPDGRTLALQAHSTRTWHRCGSERAVRGALAKMMWNQNNPPATGELPARRAVACVTDAPSTDGGTTVSGGNNEPTTRN